MRLNCVIKIYYVRLDRYFQRRHCRIGVMTLSVMSNVQSLMMSYIATVSPSSTNDEILRHEGV